jgi:hypothetical protein
MLPGGVRRQWGGAVERILGHGQQRSSEILLVVLLLPLRCKAVLQRASSKSQRACVERSGLASEGAGDRAEVRMLLY